MPCKRRTFKIGWSYGAIKKKLELKRGKDPPHPPYQKPKPLCHVVVLDPAP